MAQIIQKKPLTVETNWQKELAQSFTSVPALLDYLQLDPEQWAEHARARELFPMRVPRPFAALMEKNNWHDPLLQQVMPQLAEYDKVAGFSADPLDEHSTAIPGLLHKYHNRVLLMVRGGCAVNCRYCFRRHFPYADNSLNRDHLQQALDYIAARPQIDEVILSGGDPLMADDERLAKLASQIAAIAHVKRLRIHTRLPVVIPQRIDNAFVEWFSQLPLQRILVLHINHANEVSSELKQRLVALQQSGVTLLNQAVLLRGVNDTPSALMALSEALFGGGVLPYYLHQLDKVDGAAHFAVSDSKAQQLMAEIMRRLPGYLVPKLVREEGGKPGKTPLELRVDTHW